MKEILYKVVSTTAKQLVCLRSICNYNILNVIPTVNPFRSNASSIVSKKHENFSRFKDSTSQPVAITPCYGPPL